MTELLVSVNRSLWDVALSKMGLRTCPTCGGGPRIEARPDGDGVRVSLGKANCEICHGGGVVPLKEQDPLESMYDASRSINAAGETSDWRFEPSVFTYPKRSRFWSLLDRLFAWAGRSER